MVVIDDDGNSSSSDDDDDNVVYDLDNDELSVHRRKAQELRRARQALKEKIAREEMERKLKEIRADEDLPPPTLLEYKKPDVANMFPSIPAPATPAAHTGSDVIGEKKIIVKFRWKEEGMKKPLDKSVALYFKKAVGGVLARVCQKVLLVPRNCAKFTFDGDEMTDATTPEELDMEDDDIVDVRINRPERQHVTIIVRPKSEGLAKLGVKIFNDDTMSKVMDAYRERHGSTVVFSYDEKRLKGIETPLSLGSASGKIHVDAYLSEE